MTDRISTDLVLPDGTRYAGRLQTDANGEPVVETATCGHCGFTWNDALITAITPTPAGRCPNEYGHTYPEPEPPAYDLENPPWSAEPYNGDSDKWGDEQDRSEWFEAAAAYWCARAQR